MSKRAASPLTTKDVQVNTKQKLNNGNVSKKRSGVAVGPAASSSAAAMSDDDDDAMPTSKDGLHKLVQTLRSRLAKRDVLIAQLKQQLDEKDGTANANANASTASASSSSSSGPASGGSLTLRHSIDDSLPYPLASNLSSLSLTLTQEHLIDTEYKSYSMYPHMYSRHEIEENEKYHPKKVDWKKVREVLTTIFTANPNLQSLRLNFQFWRKNCAENDMDEWPLDTLKLLSRTSLTSLTLFDSPLITWTDSAEGYHFGCDSDNIKLIREFTALEEIALPLTYDQTGKGLLMRPIPFRSLRKLTLPPIDIVLYHDILMELINLTKEGEERKLQMAYPEEPADGESYVYTFPKGWVEMVNQEGEDSRYSLEE